MKIYIMLFIVCGLPDGIYAGPSYKKSHLSNEWYPSDPVKLKKKLQDLDEEAVSLYGASISGVRVLIVPHAGLGYSGSLAAACFRLLDKKQVRRIVLLAPSHTLPFKGIILPSYSSYRLHSGVIPVDGKMVHELHKQGEPFVFIKDEKCDPHYKEHALEIELPLIQRYVPRAKIVPLIVGTLDNQEVKQAAHILKKYIDAHTVVVVSSDFTHYGPRFDNVPFKNDALAFFKIRSLDNGLLQPIFNRSLSQFLQVATRSEMTMCGKNPLSLLLALFEQDIFKDEAPYLIGYDTSSSKNKDKDKDNSVSYVGLAFGKQDTGVVPLLTEYEKRSLNQLASHVVEYKNLQDVDQELLNPILTPALKKPVPLFCALRTDSEKEHGGVEVAQAMPLYKSVIKQAQQNKYVIV